MTTYIARDCDHTYLAHHGVKGMKWGVRRYRNYDGSLTSAGKARLDSLRASGKPSSAEARNSVAKGASGVRRLQKKNDNYDARSMTQGEAFVSRVKGRLHTIPIGQAVSYYMNGSKRMKVDDIIVGTKGKPLYRMQMNTGKLDTSQRFYATPSKRDHEKYINWGDNTQKKLRKQGKDAGSLYSVTVSKKGGFKIASENKSRKIYYDLKKSDPELFKQYSSYNHFNSEALNHQTDKRNAEAFKKFERAIKEAGYDGVIDMNDRYNSGYGVKNPVVVFGSSANVTANGRKLTQQTVNEMSRRGTVHILADRAPVVAGQAAVVAAAAVPIAIVVAKHLK